MQDRTRYSFILHELANQCQACFKMFEERPSDVSGYETIIEERIMNPDAIIPTKPRRDHDTIIQPKSRAVCCHWLY